ncbi:MAG: hypothetical protein C0606_14255 [Hyphomicrobiales bacterium]|nr:MAG: hypothetical protein C0606_14255 [Hyphomicrobiales bacterium]
MSLNSIYLTVGGLIIAALLAALVGPLFVDWNAYRATFERQAERLVGQQVKVLGEAEAFLLPTPYVTFTDVRVGDAENPLMIVSRFSARVELPPLLKGEIRVIDMTLERPDIRLALDEAGKLITLGEAPDIPAKLALAPDAVAFEEIQIVDGALRLSNAASGRVDEIRDIDLMVAARSLRGPFKADGGATIGGVRQTVSIATGATDETGRLRVKANVTPESGPASLLLDGPFGLTDGVPGYEGTFILDRPANEDPETGTTELPWRADGNFAFSTEQLGIENLEITFGTEDRRLTLNGTASVGLGPEPAFDVALSAKQIDMERMLGHTDGAVEAATASEQIASLVAAIRRSPAPPIGGRLRLDVGGVVVGGGAVQNLKAEIATTARGWHLGEITANVPGRTDLMLSGDLSVYGSGEPRFEGTLSLDVGQPAGLAAWWRASDTLAGSALEPFRVNGRLTAGTEGVSLTEASLRTERSLARGDYLWQPARPDRRATFALDVTADHLESEQLVAAARLAFAKFADAGAQGGNEAAQGAGANVSLRVVSDRLLVGDVEAAGVEALVSYTDQTLSIDRLILADLAGARVVADGTIRNVVTVPDGDLDIAVTAKSVDGIAALVADMFPSSDLARRLVSASSLLAPAVISGQFSGRADGDVTAATLKVSGEAGGSELRFDTTFDGRVDRWRDANLTVDASLSGPNGTRLLGQLGLDVLPVDMNDKGRITLKASGKPGKSLTIEAGGDIAGSAFAATGATTFPPHAAMTYAVDATLKSPDLTPLALITGRVLPVLAGEVPATLSAHIEGGSGKATVDNLQGSIVDIAVSGQGSANLVGEAPVFKGKLSLAEVDLAFLSELALGADIWSGQAGMAGMAGMSGNSRWPSVPFGPPLLGALIADFDVAADKLWLAPDRVLAGAKFKLALSPDGLALDQISGGIFGGKASGTLQVNSVKGAAGLSAALRVDDGDVAELIGEGLSARSVSGRFDATLDLDSTGRSIAALVSELAGSGTFAVRDASVTGFSEEAFPAVIAAVDDGSAMRVSGIDETAVARVFAETFTAGRTPIEKIEGVLSLASGTVWARNVALGTDGLSATGTLSFDLDDFGFNSEWTVSPKELADPIDTSPPRVSVRTTLQGDQGDTKFDVAPLMSYLNLRAYELERRRVEALKAEIIERDRLTRELRRMREEQRRRDAEQLHREEEARAAAEAEAARRAAEEARAAERRQAEEVRRKQEEEAARALREAEEAARKLLRDTAPVGPGAAAEPAPQPSPLADPLASEIEAALERAGGRDTTAIPATEPVPTASGAPLDPLPQGVDIAPAPGAIRLPDTLPASPPPATTSLPGVSSNPGAILRDPLVLYPQQRATAKPKPAAPKGRYIEGAGGRLILMPN